MNSSSSDLMSYCSLAQKKPSLPSLLEHYWSINSAQFLQILANIPGYRYSWRCADYEKTPKNFLCLTIATDEKNKEKKKLIYEDV